MPSGLWEMAMKCPNCGTKNDAGDSSCSVCGSPVGEGPSQDAGAVQETDEREGSSRLTAIIAYIVVIVVILSVPAYITISAIENVTTTKISMSVVNATEVVDPIYSPSNGNKFVQLTATMTNDGKSTIALIPEKFNILTTDSVSCDYTGCINDTVPAAVSERSAATFTITFEVPTNKTPAKLTCLPLFTSTLIVTSIGPVSPPVAHITLTVNTVANGAGLAQPRCKCVLVGFNMTNGYNETLTLTTSMFKLLTSSGTVCTWSSTAANEVPAELVPGATGSITIGFDIPISDLPQTLIYESGSVHVEADIPSMDFAASG